MRLQTSTWPEVEAYLTRSKGIVVPIGSTEQHGPNGLVGTDAICPEVMAWQAGEDQDFLVAPTFNVGSAQHHMSFPGTITLRPSTMIAAISDWVLSLAAHGFERIYFLNGHGGNIAPIQTAFSEIYARRALDGEKAKVRMTLRSWWELPGVAQLDAKLFPVGGGAHATASEVAVTFAVYPEKEDRRELSPKIAPFGPITDKDHYRALFPDGRIGSDPSQANAADGEKLIKQALAGLAQEIPAFFAS
ncbi:MAG: creatininase family protein [Alphaproteobacteria bacterium]